MQTITVSCLICSSCNEFPSHIDCSITVARVSPWEEAASSYNFWYLLTWTGPGGTLQERFITDPGSMPEVSCDKGGLFVAALYPLGTGKPLGGCYFPWDAAGEPKQGDPTVTLTFSQGMTADALLKLYGTVPEIVRHIRGDEFFSEIDAVCEGDSNRLLTRPLIWDIVTGSLSKASFAAKPIQEVTLEGLPAGFWLSETDLLPHLAVVTEGSPPIPALAEGENSRICISSGTIELELYEGVFTFRNYNSDLLLRIIVEEGGSVYWYTVRL